MAEATPSSLPKISFEQRRAAAGQFERAQEVLKSKNFDYAIPLLRKCCQLDPGNIVFRQTLRQAVRNKYQDNGRGQRLAMVTTLFAKVRLKAALQAGHYLKALEYGEDVLARNPWDVFAHLGLAEAFDALNLMDLTLWTLDQARHIRPKNVHVNRHLAQVLEKRGNFVQAMKFWELVRQAVPTDVEAQRKSKDLAASDTIARGNYVDALNEVEEPATAQPEKKGSSGPAKAAAPAVTAEERGNKEVNNLLAKIQAHPNVANNYLQLASIYRRHDLFDKARGILQEGLVPTSNHFEIAMELLDLEIEGFRRNLAITEEKLQGQPEDPDLQKMRARLVKEINTRELDYFRKKADRYPNEAVHRFEMGVRLLQLGQVDEAIKELQVIRNDPRHRAQALYYLGFCFKQRNNARLATRNFEEALQSLGPTDTEMRKELFYQLAQAYAESGDLTRAVDLGCELANLDFSYKDISALLDDWNNRLQNT